MADEPKLVPVSELLSSGIIQEVNRLFFHPLGLSLVCRKEEGTTVLAGVRDLRDIPWGAYFKDLNTEEARRKAAELSRIVRQRGEVRLKTFGFSTQPIGSIIPEQPQPAAVAQDSALSDRSFQV